MAVLDAWRPRDAWRPARGTPRPQYAPRDPPFVPANLRFVKIRFSAAPRAGKTRHMRFDFERFYQAVNAQRRARAASWRQVAREIGVGKSTLARMAQNKRPDADGLAVLAFWAGVNPADFVRPEPPPVHLSAHDELRTGLPPSA
jgi:hypothetical protein